MKIAIATPAAHKQALVGRDCYLLNERKTSLFTFSAWFGLFGGEEGLVFV